MYIHIDIDTDIYVLAAPLLWRVVKDWWHIFLNPYININGHIHHKIYSYKCAYTPHI